jgi:protein-tyrosine kinase
MERIKLAIERARQQAPALTTPPAGSAPDFLRDLDRGVPVDLLPLDPVHLERNRIVALERDGPLRAPFDLLRTQVLQKMEEHGWRTIAITSPSTQCGKTVVAINLALSIAHHPARSALLVDFDLRRPQIASYLGLPEAKTTLNEVLTGGADVNGAIVHAGIPRFLVLPTRGRVPGAAEILASERVRTILHGLRNEAPDRVVVIDLPPIAAVDDVIAVLPRVDCVLLVVGNGNSTKQQIEESRRHLARFNLVGVVINKATRHPAREEYA